MAPPSATKPNATNSQSQPPSSSVVSILSSSAVGFAPGRFRPQRGKELLGVATSAVIQPTIGLGVPDVLKL
jgi:hypothetical protein